MLTSVPTTYIGLDLAWSHRNPTGAATLRGTTAGATLVAPPALLGAMDVIVAYVAAMVGDGPAIVAVDAPLRVPNATGRRPAEADLAAVFQRFHAGAHPANRRLLDRGDGVRGELLVERLADLGFRLADRIAAGESGRIVTEVFPHPAMVTLFELPHTLKYKARPGRSTETRLSAWRSYQRHMLGLADADPQLAGHAALLATDVATLRGTSLKGYEDRVDALLCAYIGLFAHRWGEARCRTFGDLAGGFILTPTTLPPRPR
jgi:predicted RNase H-like nuclease